MTDEVIEQNPIDPVVTEPEAVIEAPAEVVSEAPELPLGDEIETLPEPKAKKSKEEKTVPVRVMLDRVGAKDALLSAAERRAADAEAMLERLQNANREIEPTPPKNTNIDDLVLARAAKLKLDDDRKALVSAGATAFGTEAFNEAAELAAAYGCVSDEFVRDVLAVDRSKAHEIYMELAKDPEKATSLANMDSRNRIAALTRMTMTTPAKVEPAKPTLAPAKQISKAPAPPPPIEPSATKTVPWYSDDASDADFDKGFYNPDRLKKRQRL